MNTESEFDAIIIGGSYAGLSAAMTLGRARRHVLVIDSGNPCNKQSPRSHNFLTRDGERPCDVTAVAREQVTQYPTVDFVSAKAMQARKDDKLFAVRADNGVTYRAPKLVFASGLTDLLPDIPGFADCWGRSVLHCPYCHGYEVIDRPTGILANGTLAFEMARTISQWTNDLTVFTNGKAVFSEDEYAFFKQRSIAVVEEQIKQLDHENGQLTQVVFAGGRPYALEVLYAHPHTRQQCDLAVKFGCRMNDHGCIDSDVFQRTSVPGIFAAGDCTSVGRAISVAVAAGTVAGLFLNKELIEEASSEALHQEGQHR